MYNNLDEFITRRSVLEKAINLGGFGEFVATNDVIRISPVNADAPGQTLKRFHHWLIEEWINNLDDKPLRDGIDNAIDWLQTYAKEHGYDL